MDVFDCNVLLVNILRCVGRLMADERTDSILRLERGFKLLESWETFLRSPRLTDAVRHAVTNLRINVVQFWTRKYDPKAAKDKYVFLDQCLTECS